MQKTATSLNAIALYGLVLVLFALSKVNSRAQHRDSSVNAVLPTLDGQQQQQLQQQQQQQGPQKAAKKAARFQGNHTAAVETMLPDVTLKYFPQAKRCKAGWVQQYAALHQDILTGSKEPRYLVSVTAGSGLADKLVGTMTLLWHAVLTDRALSVVTYPGDPALSDVCETGLFDWTQTPAAVKQDAVKLLRPSDLAKGVKQVDVTLPNSYKRSAFSALQLHNDHRARPQGFEKLRNMSSTRAPAYLLVTTNRGHTYEMATNSMQYKQRFEAVGVPASDAFMCGFFSFCSPVAAVQQYYQTYWDMLSEPGVLRIGIQIRSGDKVIEKEATGTVQQQVLTPNDVLKPSAHFFTCAERLEAAFAAPGQKVIWFLNSDSQAVRQAAKAIYGDKLLTDDSLQIVHTQRGLVKQDATEGKLKWALQHSLGSILTFSMTDVQVITQQSGFGRTGAWLADRRDRMYELSREYKPEWSDNCIPEQPMPNADSSTRWSGI